MARQVAPRHARRTATLSRLDRCDRSTPRYVQARPRTEPRRGAGKAAPREGSMAESVYKVIELVGSSTESWEKAAQAAVERAAQSLRDLRVAEVTAQDVVIENGKVEAYRTKVKVSFKYEGKD